MSRTGIRLKTLPPPMVWPPRATLPPPASHALPSYPDPEQLDEPISLHDGDFEEVRLAEPRPLAASEPPPVVYAVYAGRGPGELVLRALAPGEPPPEGVLVARIERVHLPAQR